MLLTMSVITLEMPRALLFFMSINALLMPSNVGTSPRASRVSSCLMLSRIKRSVGTDLLKTL